MRDVFVFASDIHLQECAWANRTEIAGDAALSFRQIIDYCVLHGLPLVLGGDIFDKKRPDPASVNVFISQARRMAACDLPVYFVQGDHDYWDTTAWPSLTGAASAFPPNGVQLGPWRVHGMDWTPMNLAKARLQSLASLDRCDILVTHQAWAEIQRIGTTECSVADIPFSCTLLTGDYHQHLIRDCTFDNKFIRVVSPGSTCMQAIDEPIDKAFYVISARDGVPHPQTVWLKTRPCARVVLEDASTATLAELERTITTLLQLATQRATELGLESPLWPLLRITYPDSLAIRETVLAMSGNCHVFWNPQRSLDTVQIDYQAAARRGAFDSLLSAIDELEPPDTVVNNDIRRLLAATASGNLERTLDQMEQEAIG